MWGYPDDVSIGYACPPTEFGYFPCKNGIGEAAKLSAKGVPPCAAAAVAAKAEMPPLRPPRPRPRPRPSSPVTAPILGSPFSFGCGAWRRYAASTAEMAVYHAHSEALRRIGAHVPPSWLLHAAQARARRAARARARARADHCSALLHVCRKRVGGLAIHVLPIEELAEGPGECRGLTRVFAR